MIDSHDLSHWTVWIWVLGTGGMVPRDYLRSSWEAIALSKGFQADEVCSIEFRFYRFKLAPIGQVDTRINAPGAS